MQNMSKFLMAGALSAALLSACSHSSSGENMEKQSGSPSQNVKKPPLAKTSDASDTFHGVKVNDPYRTLEPSDGEETKTFTAEQNSYARSVLDSIPQRDSVRAKVKAILETQADSYVELSEVGGKFYALKLQPPKQQRFLVQLDSLDDLSKAKTILDPSTLDPKARTAIDFYKVSPNGKWVAISLSKNGSEEGDVSIFEIASGKLVFEKVPRVYIASGGVEWSLDSSGFIYTRAPREGERPTEDLNFYTQIYYHKLGTPTEKDRYEIGKDFLKIGQPEITESKNGQFIVAVQKGDGGEFQHYLRQKDGKWTMLADYADQVKKIVLGEKDDLYAVSLRGAPNGKIVHGRIKGFDINKAKEVIPEGKDAIVADIYSSNTLMLAHNKIYVTYQTGGPSEIRTFDLKGKAIAGPRVPAVSSVSNIFPLKGGEVVFSARSFLDPAIYYRYDSKSGNTNKTAVAEKNPIDMTGYNVVREFATSKDGTKIPVNIVLPIGVKHGTPIPFVVTGYGGFNINYEPRFVGAYGAMLQSGVGYATVNLRGGSEFGAKWHEEGSLLKKQNVYDDFIAAVEHLGAKGYADPKRIAIVGGSNGGLLMGSVLTQRPELFRAVVANVGYYDMIRYETEHNGQLNATEYGSVKDKTQFEALYAYSPYHHVKKGVKYPATLFTVGATDVRVAPWHSRKMAAIMQASTSGEWPLLVTTFDAGHGAGSSVQQRVESFTDSFSFMLDKLEVK